MNLTPLALCLATAAQADPRMTWGASSATLAPCRDADACVTVINMLTGSPDLVQGVISLDGLDVLVSVTNRPGAAPDEITITPPPGWRADPATLTLDEGISARVRLFAPMVG